MTDEEHFDDDTKLRLHADLDRFMQSSSVREARDIVAGNALLLVPTVANFLSEAAKRARQLGDVKLGQSCEFRLGLLRRFREFGVEEGYLEIAIDELGRAKGAEDHRQVLLQYPELKSEAAEGYLNRRIHESSNVADVTARGKYQMVQGLIRAASIEGPDTEQADTTEAVNTFIRQFIQEPDVTIERRLLEARPDLLQSPLSVIVGGMFQPFIERARAINDLVKLRGLLLRQALFARCQKVGVAKAFEELAKGVKWSELSQRK